MPFSEYVQKSSPHERSPRSIPKRTAWLHAKRKEHSVSMPSCNGELGSFKDNDHEESQKGACKDTDESDRIEGDEGPAVCSIMLRCEAD